MSRSQVITREPDGSNPRQLGSLGNVNGLQYSYVYPGGCDAMSCNLLQPPSFRTDAMDPGRRVEVWRGLSRVWYGKLNEPSGSHSAGWSISAHGAGTLGSDYLSGPGVLGAWTAGTWNLNKPVDTAISNGLKWTNPGIGGGAFLPPLANAPDPYGSSVTDFLTTITQQAGLAWYVDRFNNLVISPIPTVPNRLLICTEPVARTIVADINQLYIKYQASDDGNGNTTYGWVKVANTPSVTQHDPIQAPIDLTGAGTISSGQATTYGNGLMAFYQRANYANTFNVRYGQLCTLGGTPIDLGTEQAATVCRLIQMDGGYGGEVVPGPVSFPVGGYEFYDDTNTAAVTPFQSFKTDLSSLLTAMIPALRQ